MTVGLVFVSHSAQIAEGLVDLARQMAPDVRLEAAGGTDDGGIGTSAELVERGIRAASDGSGIVVIGDLGSAILTAETVVELLDDPPEGGVRVLDVPLVEGGVAAAVAAQAGADPAAVARAAGAADDAGPADAPVPVSAAVAADARVTLVDVEGLHARPAAALVRTVAGFDAAVTVDGANAASLLALLSRGLRHGAEVVVRADGPDAAAAVAAVVALLTGTADASDRLPAE